MMLREDPQRLRDEFRYVQDMGLNTIRLEGKLETKEFFDLADERGILVMAGWCCCDHWEHWAELEAAGLHHRGTVAARPDVPPAQPSQPVRVAERQRQPAAARRRANLP